VFIGDVAEKAGVGHLVEALGEAGFNTAVSIRDASESDLTAVSGIGKATAAKLKAAAKELLS
jgi:predicted flap endonuclease-1-like 5' DNA nuclease